MTSRKGATKDINQLPNRFRSRIRELRDHSKENHRMWTQLSNDGLDAMLKGELTTGQRELLEELIDIQLNA